MLTDPSQDLQTAISDALKANDDIALLIGDRVYDRIPEAPTFPYITIGESQLLPQDMECTDASDSAITVHTWDRFEDFAASKTLGRLILATLHDEALTISSGTVQSMLLESAHYLRDPDGLTSHGVFTFNILTDSNPKI